MTFGSLFAGIGGFDLGLSRAGMECRWQVEIDPFCLKVLAKHWPDVPKFEDVKECGAHNLEPVDLICGGFPCQPVSCAGKQKGTDDERWLWPEFARIVREIKPRWILGENVPRLLSIDAGRIFGGVLRDLAACGYVVEWDCIPAAAVGAPHRRDRVWIVAYACGHEQGRLSKSRRETEGRVAFGGDGSFVADAMQPRYRKNETQRIESVETRTSSRPFNSGSLADAEGQPVGAGLCAGESGRERGRRSGDGGSEMADTKRPRLEIGPCFTGDARQELAATKRSCSQGAGIWATEPNVGRVAHGIPNRVDRLRSLGNAVVPQVTQWLGERIIEAAETTKK